MLRPPAYRRRHQDAAQGAVNRRHQKAGNNPAFLWATPSLFRPPSDTRRQGPEDEHGDRPESMGKDAGDEAASFPVEPAPEQARRQGGHDQHEVP